MVMKLKIQHRFHGASATISLSIYMSIRYFVIIGLFFNAIPKKNPRVEIDSSRERKSQKRSFRIFFDRIPRWGDKTFFFKVRKTLDLQFSISDRLNASLEEESGSSSGSSGSNRRAKSLGNFFADATYAWFSCGPRLVVINVKNGVSIGSWTFRERVSCVSPFPAQPGQIPLLLVGLDNGASRVRDSYGLVCVFDCTTSQVLRAIRVSNDLHRIFIFSR